MSIGKALQIFAFCAGCALIFFLLWYTVDYAALPYHISHALHLILLVLAVCVAIGGILWLMGKQPPLG